MATVVTKKGKEITVNRHIGSTPTQAEPKFLGMGLNPNALTASVNDVGQFQESPEARTTGTMSAVTTTNTNDTLQITGTQTATAGRNIQEAAVYDSATQPAVGAVAAGGVVGSNVSTTLNTAATFTPGNNSLQIRTEVLLVTAGSGTTTLTVTRGQNGSTAISTITAADVITPGNPPGQTGVVGGSMFAKGDFANQALNNGDSITWTWKVQFA